MHSVAKKAITQTMMIAMTVASEFHPLGLWMVIGGEVCVVVVVLVVVVVGTEEHAIHLPSDWPACSQ
jgi:hypothetical protein